MDNLIIVTCIIIEMPFLRGRIFLLQIFIKIKDFSSSSSSSFISSSSRITKAIIITLKTLSHLIKITLLISWIMNIILIKIKAIPCLALIIIIIIIETSQIIAVWITNSKEDMYQITIYSNRIKIISYHHSTTLSNSRSLHSSSSSSSLLILRIKILNS